MAVMFKSLWWLSEETRFPTQNTIEDRVNSWHLWIVANINLNGLVTGLLKLPQSVKLILCREDQRIVAESETFMGAGTGNTS